MGTPRDARSAALLAHARAVQGEPSPRDGVATKRQLRTEPGEEGYDKLRNFAKPEIVAIPVDYTDDERDAHARLESYTALRKRRVRRGSQNIASDFISLVLKVRLSSPAGDLGSSLAVGLIWSFVSPTAAFLHAAAWMALSVAASAATGALRGMLELSRLSSSAPAPATGSISPKRPEGHRHRRHPEHEQHHPHEQRPGREVETSQPDGDEHHSNPPTDGERSVVATRLPLFFTCATVSQPELLPIADDW